jgi:hypothetical protein
MTDTETKVSPDARKLRRARAVRACRRALFWTLGVQSASLFFLYNSYTIYAYLFTGGDILLPLALILLNLFTLFYSAYILIRYVFSAHFHAVLPAIILCLSVLILHHINPHDYDTSTTCTRFQKQREQFVHDFCLGKFPLENVHPNIYVPPARWRYKAGLSHNVYINCQDNRAVASFAIWGYIDHSIGFMYRSDDSVPEPEAQSGISFFKKIKPHWYYIID